MGMKTGVIKYNVTERGRKYRGQDRAFDTVSLANMINGGEVQERVKHRDMLGYYGHWPRIKFGMNPVEGGIIDGKQVPLEPAIVTTYIKAYPDGTVEHEAEFLDTASGRLAERLFKSKAGGFSSAIDVKHAGSKQMPRGFYGFDYVLEPNFTTNRGYQVLDGVSDEAMAVLDEVGEYNSLLESTNHILDQIQGDYEHLQGDYDRLLQTFDRVTQENEQLMSMLSKGGDEKGELVLDGLRAVVFGNRESKFDSASDFLKAELVGVEESKAEEQPAQKANAADDLLQRRFGHF